jgi:hypothetical protein
MLSTVFDADPTAYLISAVQLLDSYFRPIFDLSPDVVVVRACVAAYAVQGWECEVRLGAPWAGEVEPPR